MEPNLEYKIQKLITNHQLRTITVDVFDTIVQYDYWPTDLRYLDLAARWLPTMQRILTPSLSAVEIYELFSRTERILAEGSTSTRIDIILEAITDSICQKYDLEISEEDKIDLFASLISLEIQFEFSVSKANEKLATTLRNIKQSNPEIKIYFIARSHLVADQIRIILKRNNINDVFDDGISSCELTPPKTDQELFEQLPSTFGPSFKLKHNLHIGDQRHPDFLAPRQCNSLAIHYRPIRFRGLRTLIGRTWLQLNQYAAARREFSRIKPNRQNLWYHYGDLLGEIDQINYQHILQLAHQNPETTYLIANTPLYNSPDTKDIPQNLQECPKLTETTLIRAFIWLLATYESTHWDAPSLLKTIVNLCQIPRQNLYSLSFTNTVFSQLAINSFSDEDFWPHLLQEVRQSNPDRTSKLLESYNYIINLMSQNQNFTIIQANPDHTTMLLQNFLQLFNIKCNISTYVLDYQNKVRNLSNYAIRPTTPHQRESFIDGVLSAAQSFRKSKLQSNHYYQQVLLPELTRTAKALSKTHPHKPQLVQSRTRGV